MHTKDQRKRQRGLPMWSALSASLASITLAASVAGILSSSKISQQHRTDEATKEQMTLNYRSGLLEAAIQNQRMQQQRMNDLLQRITRKDGTGASSGSAKMSDQDKVLIDQLVEQQKELSGRLSALEGALMNDPVKALSLPLLKKDVDSIQEREKTDAVEMRSEVDRLYTFSEWFMGLIIATAISILALAIPRLRTAKKESDEMRNSGDSPLPPDCLVTPQV